MKQLILMIIFAIGASAFACPQRHEAVKSNAAQSAKEVFVASRNKQCENDNDCAAFEMCLDSSCITGQRCHTDSECGSDGKCMDGMCF